MPIPLRAALVALVFTPVSAACAGAPSADLWSLYLREHTVAICGGALAEHEETALDEAQNEARQRLRLTRQEAADLYRKAGAVARANRSSLCNIDGIGEPGTDSRVRAEWSSGR